MRVAKEKDRKYAPRRTKYKMNPFTRWLTELGPVKAAKIMKVTTATISHWKHGVCYPTVYQMKRVRKLTDGAVTYDHIIDRCE